MQGYGAKKQGFMGHFAEAGLFQFGRQPGGVGEARDAGAEVFVGAEVPGEDLSLIHI